MSLPPAELAVVDDGESVTEGLRLGEVVGDKDPRRTALERGLYRQIRSGSRAARSTADKRLVQQKHSE